MSDVHVTLAMAHQMIRDAVAAEREACAKICDGAPLDSARNAAALIRERIKQ